MKANGHRRLRPLASLGLPTWRHFSNGKLPLFADKNGELLRRDAVAAAFADADVLEWATSIPAARRSAAGVDISGLSDDLLDVIGRQWQN